MTQEPKDPSMEGVPEGAGESTILRVRRNVAKRHWSEHAMIAFVVVVTTAAQTGVLEGKWALMGQGLVSGLYAWGYMMRTPSERR